MPRSLRRLGLALLLLAPLACSDGSGPRLMPSTVRLSQTALLLDDGDTTRISATVLDQNGQPIQPTAGAPLVWSSSDPSRATVVEGLVTATRPGPARVTATVGAASASAEVTVAAVPTALELAGEAHREAVAGGVISEGLEVRVVDRHGDGVHAVRVSFEVGEASGAVRSASVLSDTAGLARAEWTLGTRAGSQELRARAEGLTGSPVSFAVTVLAGPPASLSAVAGGGQTSLGGSALPNPLVVKAVDSFGNPVSGAPVSWAVASGGGSVKPVSPATDTAGMARAVWTLGDAGENTATATLGGVPAVTFTATATAGEGTPPTISDISPALLTPGITATIRGSNFSTTASDNRVTIAGATVTRATATELTVRVPARGVLPCEPTRGVPVSVTVRELSGVESHPLRTAIARSLDVGESLLISDYDGVRCNELDGDGGRYVLSVVNTSTALASKPSFLLRGAAADAVSAARLPSFSRRASTPRPPAQRGSLSPFEGGEHSRWLESNRELARSLGRRDSRSRPAGLSLSLGGAAAVPALGDTLAFRVPNTSASSLCSTFTSVRARVVFSGKYSVIFEDTAAPLAGQMDAIYQAVGEEYERDMHPVLLANFGDPLAADSYTDANGRLYMLFTKTVQDDNKNVAGFVFAGDLFDRSICESSNQAEIFYARAATSTAEGYSSGTKDHWLWSMRATIIHEVKHLTSYSERYARDAESFEESWLEESTARVSEEIWARKVFGNAQRGNTGYAATLHCEVRPSFPECAGKPVVMFDHFSGWTDFHEGAGSRTPLGRTASDDFSFYGSGWSLVRWAIDHAAASESAFLKGLTQERSLSGVRNLLARAGRDFDEMIADWSLAAALDDRPGFTPRRAELGFPSWNVRDIFSGMNRDFSTSFPKVFPVVVRDLRYGSFSETVGSLRGGSAALFELSGTPAGPQVIELRDPSGVAPAATLRLAIVRVR